MVRAARAKWRLGRTDGPGRPAARAGRRLGGGLAVRAARGSGCPTGSGGPVARAAWRPGGPAARAVTAVPGALAAGRKTEGERRGGAEADAHAADACHRGTKNAL
ncbi:hypothetical protein GCM10020295_41400 [Streptomyces cinereospinus]